MASVVSLLRRWGSDSGAELVEFALVFPLLLLVVLGIIDFGFLFQRYEVVTNAAREGARLATLPDYQASYVANGQARALEYLDAAGLTDARRSVSVSCDTLGVGGAGYKVTVTYPHDYSFVGGIVTYFGGSFAPKQISATSTMRVEAAAGGCP
jgi:Flp pilus assembly protein TadG